MTEMAHGTIPMGSGDAVLPRWWRTIDKGILGAVLGLILCGLLLSFAASPTLAERNNLPQFFYVSRQSVFAIMSLVLMLFVSMLDVRLIRRTAVIGFFAVILALIAVLFIGVEQKGSHRWLSVMGWSLQPSEFVKPVFAILVAWFISESQESAGPPGVSISLVFTALIVLLLVAQPDFGQTALILFTWAVIYFASGASMRVLIVLAVVILFGAVLAYNGSDHFARRINIFLNDEVTPRSQIDYALNAIRAGGLFGVGIAEGEVKTYLPDSHTDFIIAVAAEEFGITLVMLIIGLYTTVVTRSLVRLMKEKDTFVRLAGTGIVCLFTVQAMVNIGVSVRLLPPKGMTLPFISYGGSSLLASGIMMGMLLALTRIRPQGEFQDILRGRGR